MIKILIIWATLFVVSGPVQAGLFDRNCDAKIPSDKWDKCVGKSAYFNSVYDGHWVDGKPDGDGVIEYSQTEAFEGTFKNGKAVYSCQGISSSRNYKDTTKSEPSLKQLKFSSPAFEKNNVRKLVSGEMFGSKFSIDLISLSLMEEFVGSAIKKSTFREYETNVGGFVLGGVLTLGIYPILNPKETARNLAGCTELRSISFEPDKEKAKPTGSKLVETKANERFFENLFFSYQGKKIEMPLVFSWVNDRYRATIDIDRFPELQKLLQESIQTPEIKISVGCITCKTESEIDQSKWILPTNFTQLPPNIEIGTAEINATLFNARVAKEEAQAKVEFDRQQALALEQRNKKAEEDKALAERERIAKEGDGSPDDLACKQRKLKPSTSAYVKCREQVLKNREIQAAQEEKRKSEGLINRSAETNTDKLSLESSKKKCTELGFKPATEGYGKCVLQLSK